MLQILKIAEIKVFFSMTDKMEDTNSSIMMQYLSEKDRNPKLEGKYSPETDKLSCVKTKKNWKIILK